jgi:23S rRNA (cytosine1962-C5)-methyltransferase
MSTPPLKVLWLKKNEDRRLNAGHAWVFSNEVDTQRGALDQYAVGETVIIRSAREQFVGYAMINPHSLICARILSRVESAKPDAEWLQQRILAAHAWRQRLGFAEHHRLVFGESDYLPGLIADRYGEVLVVQVATAWMEQRLDALVAGFAAIAGIKQIVLKNDSRARAAEGLGAYVKAAQGELPTSLSVLEAERRFEIRLEHAQKTGWFYDQRFNRQQFLALVPGTGTALDVCSYAGGWAIALARRGANVTAVDVSATALSQAKHNASLNDVSLELIQGDAFEVMQSLVEAGKRFDTIVVDPPAFIQRRKDEHVGLAAYRKLNQLAVQLLTDKGYLISCSCSYHLPTEQLPPILSRAGQFGARSLKIIANGGQSPDHPVHPAIPETRYLKAVLASVDAAV